MHSLVHIDNCSVISVKTWESELSCKDAISWRDVPLHL